MKKNFESKVSRVVRDIILKLGIRSNRKQKDNVDDIEKMERRGKEGKSILEAKLNRLS